MSADGYADALFSTLAARLLAMALRLKPLQIEPMTKTSRTFQLTPQVLRHTPRQASEELAHGKRI
jgi:hypothetical protein